LKVDGVVVGVVVVVAAVDIVVLFAAITVGHSPLDLGVGHIHNTHRRVQSFRR